METTPPSTLPSSTASASAVIQIYAHKDLQRYPHKPLGQDALHTFHEVQRICQTELSKRISRIADPKHVLWSLKIVGISEAEARPSIVFNATNKVAKEIKKFFDQAHIRTILNSCDSILNVCIINTPPRLLASENSLVISRQIQRNKVPDTTCGMLVKVTLGVQSNYGTLGGIVQVGVVLYGMVTSHIIGQLTGANDRSYHQQCVDNESMDKEGAILLDETVGVASDEVSYKTLTKADMSPDVENPLPHSRDLDWTLIPLESDLWLSNHFEKPGEQFEKSCLDLTIGEDIKQEPKSVAILTGNGVKLGSLVLQYASLTISAGGFFTDVLTLILDKESLLQHGDSGSWVVDRGNGQVYGHLVAVDSFGDGLVVPIRRVLEDIKQQTGAEHVQLPNRYQIDQLKSRAEKFGSIQANLEDDKTPLLGAAKNGHEPIVKVLTDKGDDVNGLRIASFQGHKEMVQMLLDKDADFNAQGGYHGNALQAASLEGYNEVVQMLLEKDANRTQRGGPDTARQGRRR
ncbi:hypothetical protein TruAng_012164 [Truncatella angustata]|nr:hypothetical protein TruAng_012164 [Truncatella angustata]